MSKSSKMVPKMKLGDHSIEKLFIAPVLALASYKVLSSMVDTEKMDVCAKCYAGLEYEIAAIIICLIYLMVAVTGKSTSPYAFYVALAAAVYLLPGIIRHFVHKITMSKNHTPKTIGADVAASAAIDAAKLNKPETAEEKGGEAAEKAAKSAGYSDEEAKIAKESGEKVAKAVVETVV